MPHQRDVRSPRRPSGAAQLRHDDSGVGTATAPHRTVAAAPPSREWARRMRLRLVALWASLSAPPYAHGPVRMGTGPRTSTLRRPPLPGRKSQAGRTSRFAKPTRHSRAAAVGGARPDLGAADASFARDASQAHATPRGPVDYVLVLAVAPLLVLGLLMVFSASQYYTGGNGSLFRQQLIWAALGIIALGITAQVDYHVWRRYSVAGMLVTLVLLVVILKFGQTINGGQRWLSLGLFRFQPSEAAKLAVAVYIADWLARRGEKVATLREGLAPFLAMTGVVLGLVLRQNDLGTAVILACLALAMFFTAGANVRQILATVGLAAAGMVGLVVAFSYRRARVDAFLHPLPPGCDAASSYQVCQGLIALGSGGLFGRGLGDSVQKAFYLPFPFNDSIFAVIGEELGLVGCAVVLGLFALLAYRGFRAGRRAPDAFGALLACGITCWLLTQALVNVGSVVDAIPFTGVPLPFVSLGGSSLVTSLAAVGVLLNISRTAAERSRGRHAHTGFGWRHGWAYLSRPRGGAGAPGALRRRDSLPGR